MIPTTGLREYNNRRFSGTTSLTYPTGEMKIPNWMRNGVTSRKSRYLTLSAPSHVPIPMAVIKVRIKKTGNKRMLYVTVDPEKNIMKATNIRLTAKSINGLDEALNGIIIRGK
jgi:hypothetical protein